MPGGDKTIEMKKEFWNRLDELIAASEIVIIEKCHSGQYMSCIIIRREVD
jgi:hypothetical protein